MRPRTVTRKCSLNFTTQGGKMKLFTIIALGCMALLIGNAQGAEQSPKPPFFVLFEAQKAGSVLTTELRVVEHRRYMFTLELGVNKGTTTEETMENGRRLMDLAGGNARDINGKPLSYGISIPLRLKVSVIKSSGERIIYGKEIYKEEMIGGGSGRGFTKLIDYIELKPGLYKIDIQSMKDIPELAENPITFGIYGRTNSNPID